MSKSDPTQGKYKFKQNIILDTCIIQYLLTPNLNKEVKSIMLVSISKGFGLAISEISILEGIQSASESKEKEVLERIFKFPIYSINTNILIAAGQLKTLYTKDSNISENNISVGDAIIGATAVLTNSLIVTANYNDYPRPFFIEKYKKALFYNQKNKQRLACLYILKPNMPIINFRFSERPKR